MNDLQARYSGQITMVRFVGIEELVTKEKDGLLVMSHLSYTKLSEDELVMRELSSLLVIRRNKNKGEKMKDWKLDEHTGLVLEGEECGSIHLRCTRLFYGS